MIKIKFHLVVPFFSLLFLAATILPAQTAADEYMAISETLSYYLDGGTNNDFSRLSKAFHKDATMKHVGDEYKSVNALEFFGNAMKPGPPSDRKTRIVSINFNGKAANAVLNISFPKAEIWDFMNLLKIDGKWKIVNKIFYVEQIEKNNESEPIISQEEKEVLTLLHRWKMAFINKDAEEVEEILADDWTYSGERDGQLKDKKILVEETRSPKSEFLEINFQNLKTRKVGDLIFVSGQEELKIKEDGQVKWHHLMFTDAYQKIDGRWQAIFTHSSEVKKN